MPRLRLFFRLMVRPLLREPIRTSLMVLAIALGIGVVLAIELAGEAATGSFRSSMETLTGDNNLEITASGGVPDAIVGTLASLPYDLRISPRIEGYASIPRADALSARGAGAPGARQMTLPLIGLDLVAEAGALSGRRRASGAPHSPDVTQAPEQSQRLDEFLKSADDPSSIWVGTSMHRAVGDRLRLLINDHAADYVVRGIYPDGGDSSGDSTGRQPAIVMDIATAQRALGRTGRLDRILLKAPVAGSDATPEVASLDDWQRRIAAALPPGVAVSPEGAGTDENRRMLAAFRWNLRLLSYISLVVGAFLIYNTISISVVRRRPEIGIVRALGATRAQVLGAFLGEAATLGLAGAALGLPIGRFMAAGAVKLMGVTVESLYVSSSPGPIALTFDSFLLAAIIGLAASLGSAFSPAREAVSVPPVQALARGRREFDVAVHKSRNLQLGLLLALGAALASRAPAVGGKPYFGYVACLALVAAAALMMPWFVSLITRAASYAMGRRFGAEALLASRSLAGSLRRTSVLVAALATAIAMMVSVGIMVGSFRETVINWMDAAFPADLFVRPAVPAAADRHPTLSPELTALVKAVPGVAAVDRRRAYEIHYGGLPVTLAGVDLSPQRMQRPSDFFSGRGIAAVMAELRAGNNVAVSEPFTYKHHAAAGDTITLPLGEQRVAFHIVDVYYDYSSERGEILMDLAALQRYLPDPAPSNLAVHLAPGADSDAVRAAILDRAAAYDVAVISNRELRTGAVRVFDRTFVITYALETIAVAVAVLGVAGALLALVIDRRRELSLLRFLGADSAQIRKLILFEAGFLGLLANLAGAVLGYFLSLILIFVIDKQSFGWTIRFHWPTAVLLGALTVVYLATIAAGVYPASIAVALDPIEAVHED